MLLVTTGLWIMTMLSGDPYFMIRSQEIEEFFLLRPEKYKARDIPFTANGTHPFSIKVDLDIWTIAGVSLEQQHMEVELLLSVSWMDYALKMSPNVSSAGEWVEIGKEVDYIWTPSLSFRNCKGCDRISFKSNSQIPVFVQKTTGLLWTQTRELIKFTCDIRLESYPMDVQTCLLQVYSAQNTVKLLAIEHYKEDYYRTVTSNTSLLEFAEPIIHTGHCLHMDLDGDVYSCLELTVHFERLLGYHLVTAYIPTAIIVGLSWISFWIPVDVVPARIALGLTSLLTLATRLDQAQKHLPAVSYAKAIDVWMLACIIMVSLSLVEFVVASYLSSKQTMKTRKKQLMVPKYKNSGSKFRHFSANPRKVFAVVDIDTFPAPQQPIETCCDNVSKVIFPTSFVIFNLVYWVYYLNET